jgi:hypothetical protein
MTCLRRMVSNESVLCSRDTQGACVCWGKVDNQKVSAVASFSVADMVSASVESLDVNKTGIS